MIPKVGCNPKVNILTIGGQILALLKHGPSEPGDLLQKCHIGIGVSIDHIILTLDWLYSIGAIKITDSRIYINEANKT